MQQPKNVFTMVGTAGAVGTVGMYRPSNMDRFMISDEFSCEGKIVLSGGILSSESLHKAIYEEYSNEEIQELEKITKQIKKETGKEFVWSSKKDLVGDDIACFYIYMQQSLKVRENENLMFKYLILEKGAYMDDRTRGMLGAREVISGKIENTDVTIWYRVLQSSLI